MPNAKKHTESKDTENPGKVDMGGHHGGATENDRDPQARGGQGDAAKDDGKGGGDRGGTEGTP